jgi:hypothetical protein
MLAKVVILQLFTKDHVLGQSRTPSFLLVGVRGGGLARTG